MSQFTNYLDSVNGVALDVDGNYGPQCWDLWTHYSANLIGVNPWWLCGTQAGGGHAPHNGFTCGIWWGFDNSGLNQWYTAYGPEHRAQAGDVAIWEYGYPATPYSHVAIVVEDRGGSLYTMTQNPGACHYGQITKNGLLGYLRPDNQSFFGGDGGGSSIPAPTNPGWGGTYTVQPGDSLSGIASNYGISWQELYAANTDVIGGNPNQIVPGQVLRVPGESAPAPAPAPSGGSKQRVIVPGDTLWDISAQELGNGSRYMEIFNLSNFRSGDPGLIFPGEIAIIP